jgi:hypothetical protein
MVIKIMMKTFPIICAWFYALYELNLLVLTWIPVDSLSHYTSQN